jgi:hypothetical protein
MLDVLIHQRLPWDGEIFESELPLPPQYRALDSKIFFKNTSKLMQLNTSG